MFNINSNNGMIVMTRADTWETSIFVNIGTKIDPVAYELKDEDILYFGVMEPNQPFDDALICKKITKKDIAHEDDEKESSAEMPGYYNIKFKSEDTEYLLPGLYYYEIKLLRPGQDGESDKIDTIVRKTKFIIME